jgi:hypothetical protein
MFSNRKKDEKTSFSFLVIRLTSRSTSLYRHPPPPPDGATAPRGPAPHYRAFAITLGKTPPDEGSARRRDIYLTTHNIHKSSPWSRRDSSPQSQQANGRRPESWTARPQSISVIGKEDKLSLDHRIYVYIPSSA